MKNNIIKLFTVALSGLLINACSEVQENAALTMTVVESDFAIVIPAKGELQSANEVIVSAPNAVRSNLTLSWLKEENSLVKKGDVVARFDGEQNIIQRDKADLELQKLQLTKNNTENKLSVDQYSIEQQAIVIKDELDMTEKFSTEDLSIYSKNEVIELLLNKDFLTAKTEYLDWSKDSKTDQSTAQIKLLSIRSKGHSQTMKMHNTALSQLEVKAPADGIFIHSKNWRGEKVREGSTMWPGSKLASIPNLEQMQAKLYVLENEAAGVKIGQKVELVMDAYPDRAITGEVSNIASIATPRQQINPVKYFELIIALDNTDPSFMKPGQKVTASIFVHKQNNAISLPNQVIFQKDNQQWVYVKNGTQFDKKNVKVSKRSLTKSLLSSGVAVGDEVALIEPEAEHKS